MPPTPTGDATPRRFVVDNFLLFLWAGYVVPVSTVVWGGGSIVGGLMALVAGHAAAMLVVVRPGLATSGGAEPTGGRIVPRLVRLVALTSLFGLAMYLAYGFLLALVDDLGLLSGHAGWSGLDPISPPAFLIFAGYWAVLLSVLAERLVAWIRELMKIDRMVCLGVAGGLLIGRLSGRLGPLPGNAAPSTGPVDAAGIAFAWTMLMGLGLGAWRGRLPRGPKRWQAAGLLVLGGPVVVAGVLAVIGSTPGDTGGELPSAWPAGPIPGGEVAAFNARTDGLIPWWWARALVNLAMSLGSMGIGVYLANLVAGENLRGRGLNLRMGWVALAVVVAAGLLAVGLLEDLKRFYFLGAVLVAPLFGLGLAGAIWGARRAASPPALVEGIALLGPIVLGVVLVLGREGGLWWLLPPGLLLGAAAVDRLGRASRAEVAASAEPLVPAP